MTIFWHEVFFHGGAKSRLDGITGLTMDDMGLFTCMRQLYNNGDRDRTTPTNDGISR